MPAGVACRRSQQGRADRHLVHEAVMLAVDGAFGHDLRMHRHAGEELLFVGAHWPEPVAADAIAQSAPPIWCRPDRRVMPKVVPDVNALVQFGSGPASHPRSVDGVRLVRDTDVVAVVTAPHPAVERALDPTFDNAAAVGEVGTHVPAVRVEDADSAVDIAESDELCPEVVQRFYVADQLLGAPGHLEPAGGSHVGQPWHLTESNDQALSLRLSLSPLPETGFGLTANGRPVGTVLHKLPRRSVVPMVRAAVYGTTAATADERGRRINCASTGVSGQSRRLRAALWSRSTSSPVCGHTRCLSIRPLPSNRHGVPSGCEQPWWIWLDANHRCATESLLPQRALL